MMLKQIILFCVVFCVTGIVIGSNVPEIKLNDARILGSYSSAKFKDGTKDARMYLGIPYAKPPIGKYRFKKTKLLTSMPSVVKATQFKPGCLQAPRDSFPFDIIPENQSEDCLYLNVFVPGTKPDKDVGHAVMVFIHGGGFMFGSGDLRPEYLSTHGNVIVVSINYRLGIFGFLSTGDRYGPGNLGLWDQHLALQWVHNNIAAFGGDNKRVTIFGESAGSCSVMYQALYPKNDGLFQRVIAESGTPSMKMLFQYKPLDVAKYFADALGCEHGDNGKIITCLQSRTAHELNDKQNELFLGGKTLDEIGLVPNIDNDFILFDVVDVEYNVGNTHPDVFKFYHSLDIINGVNSAEGLLSFTPQYVPVIDNPETFKPTRQQMDEEAIPAILSVHYVDLDKPLLRLVSASYTDWSSPDCPERLRTQLVKLGGDLSFVIPAVQYSRLHVNTTGDTNSYIYYLKAKPTSPILPAPSWSDGSNHADDLSYVFHFRLSSAESHAAPPADWEYDLSLDIMRYWTNFAKTGNPNKPEKVKVQWTKYDLNEQSYLELDKNMSDKNSKKYFHAEEAEFWLNTIPDLRRAIRPSKKGPIDVHGACSADGECESP